MTPSDKAQREYSWISSFLLCLTSLCCCCASAAAQPVAEPTAVRLVPSVTNLSGTPFNEVRLCAPFSILVAPGDYGVSILAEPQVGSPHVFRLAVCYSGSRVGGCAAPHTEARRACCNRIVALSSMDMTLESRMFCEDQSSAKSMSSVVQVVAVIGSDVTPRGVLLLSNGGPGFSTNSTIQLTVRDACPDHTPVLLGVLWETRLSGHRARLAVWVWWDVCAACSATTNRG